MKKLLLMLICAMSICAHAEPRKMTIKNFYFKKIVSGEKTIEGRLNRGFFKRVQEGEFIEFINSSNRSESVVVQIFAKRIYRTFRQMLEHEGVEYCLPGVYSVEHGSKIYARLPGYAQGERESGVVALEIGPLNWL